MEISHKQDILEDFLENKDCCLKSIHESGEVFAFLETSMFNIVSFMVGQFIFKIR